MNADMDLANVLKYFNISESVLGRDEWVNIFSKSYSFTGRKSKFVKQFGLKLASTNPDELFLPHEFNGERMLHGRIQNAWAGAYTFYGPGWKPEVVVILDITNGLSKPTPWWNKIDPVEIQSVAPFKESEIFSDDPESLHDVEGRYRIKFGLKDSKDPKDWMAGFHKFRKDEKVRQLVIKLALTPISVFGKEWFADPEQTKLKSCSLTILWVSVYRIAGRPWAPKPPTKTPTPTYHLANSQPRKEKRTD